QDVSEVLKAKEEGDIKGTFGRAESSKSIGKSLQGGQTKLVIGHKRHASTSMPRVGGDSDALITLPAKKIKDDGQPESSGSAEIAFSVKQCVRKAIRALFQFKAANAEEQQAFEKTIDKYIREVTHDWLEKVGASNPDSIHHEVYKAWTVEVTEEWLNKVDALNVNSVHHDLYL